MSESAHLPETKPKKKRDPRLSASGSPLSGVSNRTRSVLFERVENDPELARLAEAHPEIAEHVAFSTATQPDGGSKQGSVDADMDDVAESQVLPASSPADASSGATQVVPSQPASAPGPEIKRLRSAAEDADVLLEMLRTFVTDLDDQIQTLLQDHSSAVAVVQRQSADWDTSRQQILKELTDGQQEAKGLCAAAEADPAKISAATQTLEQVQGSGVPAARALADRAMEAARTAFELAAPDVAQRILSIADAAQAWSQHHEAKAGETKKGWRSKEKATDAVAWLDGGNNVATGLIGGTTGAVAEAAGAASHLSAIAAGATGLGLAAGVFSILGGGFGIAFGLIGLGLGINAFVHGLTAEKRLRKLIPSLKGEFAALATYAGEQKRKKKWRGAAVGTAGLLAVLAGAAGMTAFVVGTFGVGALILGLGAAAIGIGLVAYKYFKRQKKRMKELKGQSQELAEMLVEAARRRDPSKPPDEQDPSQQEACARIRALHSDPDLALMHSETLIAELAPKLEGAVRSARQKAAAQICGALLSDIPSERVQAEMLLTALSPKLKPEKLRDLKLSDAVSKIEKKLASW